MKCVPSTPAQSCQVVGAEDSDSRTRIGPSQRGKGKRRMNRIQNGAKSGERPTVHPKTGNEQGLKEKFNKGDLVWMQTRQERHWKGPCKIIEKISDRDYRLRGRKLCHIVHFNRLKLCKPGTRFCDELDDADDPTTSDQSTAPDVFGEDMELLDADPRRQRHRHPPDRFAEIVSGRILTEKGAV